MSEIRYIVSISPFRMTTYLTYEYLTVAYILCFQHVEYILY